MHGLQQWHPHKYKWFSALRNMREIIYTSEAHWLIIVCGNCHNHIAETVSLPCTHCIHISCPYSVDLMCKKRGIEMKYMSEPHQPFIACGYHHNWTAGTISGSCMHCSNGISMNRNDSLHYIIKDRSYSYIRSPSVSRCVWHLPQPSRKYWFPPLCSLQS